MSQASRALIFDSEHKRRAENLAFDLDVWYPRLAEFTFPTVFLPLTTVEAQATIHCYQQRFAGRRGALSTEDVLRLHSLERRVDEALCEDSLRGGAFPRLCGRSLKDADPLRPKDALQAYEMSVRDLRDANPDAPVEMQALLRVEWMKVQSGAEVLSLLLSSERAFVDLKDWVNYGEPEQLALRQWQPELTIDWEFRLFVYEGQLTGISQYDHYCHYPDLHAQKRRLEPMIVDFWRRFHPCVGVDSYLADVGYLPSKDALVLVELGPFLPCSGASCFRWTADTEQLKNGPLEFRLRTAGDALPKETLAELVDNVIYHWRKPYAPYTDAFDSTLALAAGVTSVWRVPCSAAAALGALAAIWLVRTQSRQLNVAVITVAAMAAGAAAVQRSRSQERSTTMLFVYGTLKSGFHWNQKFLSLRASFVADAETVEPWPLVIGQCGVPYVLLNWQEPMGEQCVRGELWQVDDEGLAGLDDYEGITKGYYGRTTTSCRVTSLPPGSRSPQTVQAQIYGLLDAQHLWTSREIRMLECVPEYTLTLHRELYRPIEHILLKQQLYLANAPRYNDVDNHVRPVQKS